MRKHVVNTIENATNYVNQETGEPSAIKRQLEALRSGSQGGETPKQKTQEQPKVVQKTPVAQQPQALDNDLPF